MTRIAICTATMGGAGHVSRLLALERGLKRQGFQGEVRSFGPPIPYPSVQFDGYTPAVIQRSELGDPHKAAQSQLGKALVEFQPDVLLIDLFWLPLYYIYRLLPKTEFWLFLHTVPREWFRGSVKLRFRPSQFHRILAAEPMEYRIKSERVEPVVVCNPSECKPRNALRERLGVRDDETLTLVLQTGMKGEAEEIEASLKRSDNEKVCVMSMHREDAIFPIAPWLSGADRIYGGGGYNFFWESKWLGLSSRCVYQPFSRKIDNQAWRIEECYKYIMQENGADQIARMMMQIDA